MLLTQLRHACLLTVYRSWQAVGEAAPGSAEF
jgi:hypothetical protein